MNAPITTQTWLARFAAVHGDHYTYPSQDIRSGRQRITIVCPEHGAFEQTPQKHAEGDQCRACSYVRRGSEQRHTRTTWIARARTVHGARYGYDSVQYCGDRERVVIHCPEHGEFSQIAGTHLQGRGCPACGNLRKAAGRQRDLKHFLTRASAVHGELYDYSRVDYIAALAKVTIICRKHGPFDQTPANHTHGYGCPRCCNGVPSPTECDLFDFVRALCPDAQQSDRSLIKPKELDIIVPSRRVAIELNGVYWHSDRRSTATAAQMKRQLCEATGYRLLQITCDEWKTRRGPFEALVRNALGCSDRPRVHARDCRVESIDNTAAVAFLDAHHPQQPGAVYGRRYGLVHPMLGLVALMTFDQDRYGRNRKAKGQWDLTRYATSALVRGGASRLFIHAQRDLQFDSVVSYSTNDWFDGALYVTLGFKLMRDVPADYRVYHHALGFRPKSAWARSQLPARLRQIGREDIAFDPATDPRTEWAIEDAVNALRVWDSGKKLWRWTKKGPA